MTKNYIKVLAVAGVIALTTSVNAQVAMTKNLAPIGTTYGHGVISGSFPMPEEGANKTWDYSSVAISLNANYSFEVISVASLPATIQTVVPDGEYAVKLTIPISGEEKYSVYDERNDTLFTLLNEVKEDNVLLNDYDRIDVVFNTLFNGSFQHGKNFWNNTWEYAGYGTLKLGSNTYNDVILFKVMTGTSLDGYFFYQVTPFNLRLGGVTMSGFEEFRITESTTGISKTNANNFVGIYPNPTNNTLNIEVKETTNIKIVNVLGATVATQKLNAGNNSIDVSNLTNGVYFISNNKGGVTKFIKE